MYLMISGGGYESLNVMSFTTLEELKNYVHGMNIDRTKNHDVYETNKTWRLPELVTERHTRTVRQCVRLEPMEYKTVTFEAYGNKKEADDGQG